MRGVEEAVQKADGDRPDAGIPKGSDRLAHSGLVERGFDMPVVVVGSGPLPRGQVVSKVWEYIRSHNLQNPENRREILADDKLRRVFGKDKVTMFEMNKHLAAHLK